MSVKIVRTLAAAAACAAALLTARPAAAQCGTGGNCYQQHTAPGCNHVSCCNTVCAVDPWCCTNNWDNICVAEALDLCTPCGEPGAGSCYEPHFSAGCNNLSCCDFVCEIDSFCCNNQWDSICVDEAFDLCANCGEPSAGNCFAVNGTPGCSDQFCCTYVCEQDPFCCETSWDSSCATIALLGCAGCGSPSLGSCLSSHFNTGCNDFNCCEAVCAVDPFCCTNNWDNFCVSSANQMCATCGGSGATECYNVGPLPSCADASCCNAVCMSDPFCCQSEWDDLCVTGALYLCYGSGVPEAGDCYTLHSNPGCNSLSCSAAVCLVDSYCCQTEWDELCVAEAEAWCCPQDCVNSTSFSWPNDGIVDGADLAVLLGDWGPCRGCCSDAVTSATFAPPPDGVVDGADLAVMLGAWGSPGCPN